MVVRDEESGERKRWAARRRAQHGAASMPKKKSLDQPRTSKAVQNPGRVDASASAASAARWSGPCVRAADRAENKAAESIAETTVRKKKKKNSLYLRAMLQAEREPMKSGHGAGRDHCAYVGMRGCGGRGPRPAAWGEMRPGKLEAIEWLGDKPCSCTTDPRRLSALCFALFPTADRLPPTGAHRRHHEAVSP